MELNFGGYPPIARRLLLPLTTSPYFHSFPLKKSVFVLAGYNFTSPNLKFIFNFQSTDVGVPPLCIIQMYPFASK